MILAYSVYLGARLDYLTLEKLGIKEVVKNVKILEGMGFVHTLNNVVYINNYNLLKPILLSSLKNSGSLCRKIYVKNVAK